MDVTDMQLYYKYNSAVYVCTCTAVHVTITREGDCPTSTKKYVVPELVCVLVTYYPKDLDQQSAIRHERVHRRKKG
jgi:hypothetical protein